MSPGSAAQQLDDGCDVGVAEAEAIERVVAALDDGGDREAEPALFGQLAGKADVFGAEPGSEPTLVVALEQVIEPLGLAGDTVGFGRTARATDRCPCERLSGGHRLAMVAMLDMSR